VFNLLTDKAWDEALAVMAAETHQIVIEKVAGQKLDAKRLSSHHALV
jgi:hypothetical protein